MEITDKIRIKCPNCGAILEAADDPANAGKSVRCPNCKVRNKFNDFKRVIIRQPSEDDSTQICACLKGDAGYLMEEISRIRYPHKEGRNLVGRKTIKTPSMADVPIETADLGMSREHMYLDVVRGVDGYYHVYASNAKNKNETTINGVKLEDGDKIGLRHGDVLKLCDTRLVYVGTPINDETEL